MSKELIKTIYDNFTEYFKSGDIIIGGSYFYDRIGVPIEKTFKDIDLIVDNSKDNILYELISFFRNNPNYELDEQTSFITNFDGKYLISCILFKNNEHTPIDILRQDFSTNLSSLEIIPGVFTNYQTSEKLVEVYEDFIKGFRKSGKIDKIKKFVALRDFYKKNSTRELVQNLNANIS